MPGTCRSRTFGPVLDEPAVVERAHVCLRARGVSRMFTGTHESAGCSSGMPSAAHAPLRVTIVARIDMPRSAHIPSRPFYRHSRIQGIRRGSQRSAPLRGVHLRAPRPACCSALRASGSLPRQPLAYVLPPSYPGSRQKRFGSRRSVSRRGACGPPHPQALYRTNLFRW
jgi:hypothetical protein